MAFPKKNSVFGRFSSLPPMTFPPSKHKCIFIVVSPTGGVAATPSPVTPQRMGHLVGGYLCPCASLLGIRKGGGGAKRIVRFFGGETYHKAPPPKPVLEA